MAKPSHTCLAANLRIGINDGEMFLNRLLNNGWSALDDFSADPKKIQF